MVYGRVDFKYRIGVSLLVAFVTAILIYTLLNPFVIWYIEFVPGLPFFNSCTGNDVICGASIALFAYGLPIIALFLGIASIFEVFL
jgi:hypothetical protein